MTTEENETPERMDGLIAPHVEDLSANQYWITDPQGEWFQSYQTTVAFKGEFMVLLDRDWYQGVDMERSVTTVKYLCKFLSEVMVATPEEVERRAKKGGDVNKLTAKEMHKKVANGEIGLTDLSNYNDPVERNTVSTDPELRPLSAMKGNTPRRIRAEQRAARFRLGTTKSVTYADSRALNPPLRVDVINTLRRR